MQHLLERWSTIGLLVVALLALMYIVQLADDSPDAVPVESTGAVGAVGVASPAALPSLTPSQPPASTPTSSLAIPSATHVAEAEATTVPVEQYVLRYLEMVGAVRSGEVEVRCSQPVLQQQLIDVGLAMLPLRADCERPLHLVIVAGDFDVRGMAPGWSRSNQPPVAFLGFVYDVEADVFAQIMTSENGAIFKLALNDPSLPNPAPEEMYGFDPSSATQCETVITTADPEPTTTHG